jgi:hypothetical protein
VTPDHFVFVCRLDGHMCLANAKALAAANITKDSPEVAGGTITRSVLHRRHRHRHRQNTHTTALTRNRVPQGPRNGRTDGHSQGPSHGAGVGSHPEAFR